MGESLAAIDLFGGAGGSSLGLRRGGYEVVMSLETDRDANNTYEKNLGVKPLAKDIRKTSISEILRCAGVRKDGVYLVVGCPPCQGFTRLNRNSHSDMRNGLIETFAKIATKLKPELILFENVPAAAKSIHFRRLKDILTASDYRFNYAVLNAVDYGVPQHRKRLILVAAQNTDTTPKLPEPRFSKKGGKGKKPWKTVRESISDLPPIEAGEHHPDVPNHVAMGATPRILKLIRNVPKDGGGRLDLPKRMWLNCHKRASGFYDVYGRMLWDAPSNTITSGCTNPSKGRFIHPEQDRAISAREAARLQGFPDWYVFEGTLSSVSRQIGNSFPPTLMEKIISAIST